MPKRLEPSTLRRVAMLTIADHFEFICYHGMTRKDITDMLESGYFLEIEGPFFDLPSSVTDDLIEVIKERRTVIRHIYHQLVDSKTKKLYLGHGIGEIYYALKFIQDRCQNLCQLDLSYTYQVSPAILLELFQHLPKLQILNLQRTLAVDEVIKVIGDNCLELYDLNLSATPVTDVGLSHLCIDELGNPRVHSKLFRVALDDNQVTYNGVFFLLHTLRDSISELSYDGMLNVMERDRKFVQANGDDAITGNRTYKLRSLRINKTNVNAAIVEYSVLKCPLVNHVILSNVTLTDEALLPLANLKTLSSLSITNQQDSPFSFEKGIVPLMEKTGQQIKDLILCNFSYCDLEAIGLLCPNIQKFAVSGIGRFENRVTRLNVFNKLVVVELWLNSDNYISEMGLKQILCNCQAINNILVKGCETLSDDLFIDIWQANSMSQLSHLTLDDCHNISVATLTVLMSMENQLDFIRTWGCSQIKRMDWENILSAIKKENLDLYFEWYE